jgi:hypothetical protein
MLIMKNSGFRFLHRIARTESSSTLGYHHFRTQLSFRRPFQTGDGESVFSKGQRAWNNSKVTWYSLPVSMAITYIALMHLYKVTGRNNEVETATHTHVEGPFHVMDLLI